MNRRIYGFMVAVPYIPIWFGGFVVVTKYSKRREISGQFHESLPASTIRLGFLAAGILGFGVVCPGQIAAQDSVYIKQLSNAPAQVSVPQVPQHPIVSRKKDNKPGPGARTQVAASSSSPQILEMDPAEPAGAINLPDVRIAFQ